MKTAFDLYKQIRMEFVRDEIRHYMMNKERINEEYRIEVSLFKYLSKPESPETCIEKACCWYDYVIQAEHLVNNPDILADLQWEISGHLLECVLYDYDRRYQIDEKKLYFRKVQVNETTKELLLIIDTTAFVLPK